MTFDEETIKWVFSGIGVLGLSALGYLVRKVLGKSESSSQSPAIASIVISQTNGSSADSAAQSRRATATDSLNGKTKAGLAILFIDDDTKFKVVNILKSHGWSNTKIIRDVTSLEQPDVAAADIFFVDIQGVGKVLQFKDEGLGLVVALKKKYPGKKLVIYSAENGLNAFHAAFKAADDRISKDADPYEFCEVVERLSS